MAQRPGEKLINISGYLSDLSLSSSCSSNLGFDTEGADSMQPSMPDLSSIVDAMANTSPAGRRVETENSSNRCIVSPPDVMDTFLANECIDDLCTARKIDNDKKDKIKSKKRQLENKREEHKRADDKIGSNRKQGDTGFDTGEKEKPIAKSAKKSKSDSKLGLDVRTGETNGKLCLSTSHAMMSSDYREPDIATDMISRPLTYNVNLPVDDQSIDAKTYASTVIKIIGGRVEDVIVNKRGAAMQRYREARDKAIDERNKANSNLEIRNYEFVAMHDKYKQELSMLKSTINQIRQDLTAVSKKYDNIKDIDYVGIGIAKRITINDGKKKYACCLIDDCGFVDQRGRSNIKNHHFPAHHKKIIYIKQKHEGVIELTEEEYHDRKKQQKTKM